MKLANKKALITGASVGIGREIARFLAAEGASLGLVARSHDKLEQTKQLLGKCESHIFCADLRDESAIESLGRAVQASMGEIDVLINCAGVWHDSENKYHGPYLSETPTNQIDEIFEVGLRASFLVNRLFLPG